MRWRPVGNVSPHRLTVARLELHWATQLVSAPGTTLLPAAEDYSHTNLVWDLARGVLVGRAIGEEALRAALVFESLELAVLRGETGRVSRALAGSTLDQALVWLGNQFEPSATTLRLPEHDMPSHPVGDGASFSDADPDARVELAAWFSNAMAAVRQAVAEETGASPVRCWPHHFDVASLITVDAGNDSEETRSIGVGFSPGDGSYGQPYFYVTPWPYPQEDDLPALDSGMRWHTEGWTGAVLTTERLLDEPAVGEADRLNAALRGAIAACRAVLEA